ncbi:MAG: hypothetical protein DRJ51_05370 [Thermoprotei archaeon]|nr:MAG: hypothetical protein DRJ51_05370 [Thermoprotei archaeon]
MDQVVNWSLIVKIVISFLAGALIGLEREKARVSVTAESEKFVETPGVRSFGFISLLGCFTMILPEYIFLLKHPYPGFAISIVIAGLIMAILALYSYYRLVLAKEAGITTLVALVLAYTIGATIGLGLIIEGIAVSVFATFMLAVKLSIEKAIKGVTYRELLSALEIGIIVFLLGPFFMGSDVTDPLLHIINIRVLYIFFVIILILSYIGYMTMKIVGPSALTYFAFFGGLVHSEATVISLGKIARDLGKGMIAVKGALTASLAMIIRNVFLLLGLIAFSMPIGEQSYLIEHIALAASPAILIGLFLLKVIGRGIGELKPGAKFPSEKPISYAIAFKAVIVFLAILVMNTYAALIGGNFGALVSAALGGLMSAEAVIFSSFSLMIGYRIAPKIMLASSLLAVAVALLNKIIFLKTCEIDKKSLRTIFFYQLLLSTPFLITSLYLVIALKP